MHQAQFVLKPSREAAWAQVSKVRDVLESRFVFGAGKAEESDGGLVRTVFVDRADDANTPSVIEVAEDPARNIHTLLIRTSDPDSFADMLGAVKRNVDAVPLEELAADAEADRHVDALDRLALGLVGVRFDRASYQAIASALENERPGIRARAALAARELGWRSLLRPLWRSLARQKPGTATHIEVAKAFNALDHSDDNVRYVLSRHTTLDDVATLSKIAFDLEGCELTASGTEASFTVRDGADGLAWAATRSDGVIVLELGASWGERGRSLVTLLDVQQRPELLEAASAEAPDALLRLASTGRRYDALIDELLVLGLRSTNTAIRLDALIAIATAEWDSAIPDLEDVVEGESDLEARQLARAMLLQHRGY